MEEADKRWVMTAISVSGWMFLLLLAHPGCPGQNPESRKMVVVVVRKQQQLFYGTLSGTPRWAGTRRNIHPLTPILIIILYQLPPSTKIHSILPVPIVCLTVFCTTSIQVLLVYHIVWNPSLHTPYISSLSHCLLFTTHAHTNATCFPVVTRLCHVFLISLSTLLRTLCFTLLSHIHLTIHISARFSATLFFFLTGQVSLPCNILLCIQLLYSLPLIMNDISILVSSGTNCLNLFYPIRI